MININGSLANHSFQPYKASDKPEDSQTAPNDCFFPSNVGQDAFYGVIGAGISAVPILGAAVLNEVADVHSGFLLNSAPAINLGSTIALGVGLFASGPLLAAGLTGLGVCAVVGGAAAFFNHE
ncbi:hypothetical protein IV102_15690 [bacterium]|nr:hypothetical protein [bacterium]